MFKFDWKTIGIASLGIVLGYVLGRVFRQSLDNFADGVVNAVKHPIKSVKDVWAGARKTFSLATLTEKKIKDMEPNDAAKYITLVDEEMNKLNEKISKTEDKEALDKFTKAIEEMNKLLTLLETKSKEAPKAAKPVPAGN